MCSSRHPERQLAAGASGRIDALSPDAIYDFARPLQVAVSPDGARVAVQMLEYDREAGRQRSVVVVPADSNREPTRLTPAGAAATMVWFCQWRPSLPASVVRSSRRTAGREPKVELRW